MKKIIYSLSFFLLSSSFLSANEAFHQYIAQYKQIAIQEMYRTGVPASIKLAQGLLESNAGRSTLAQKANNHFGIKCGGKQWKGKTYYRKDDDYKRGKLVKSCFRKYKNSQASFLAHSDFLKKDNFSRYGFLFQLPTTDYKKWAKGLKKAGYATSKTYSQKLIKIIEEYKLYKYDTARASSTYSNQPFIKKELAYQYINDVKMVFAQEGDTPTSIAKRLNTSPNRIVSYNEQITNNKQSIKKETPVFIQKKRKRFRGKKKYHTVQSTETLYDIAQLYGLRLDKLYDKNKMPVGSEAAVGERINLKRKAKKSPHFRTNQNNNTSKQKTNSSITPSETGTILQEDTFQDSTPNSQSTIYHTVIKGETLWRISKKYDISVEQIMSLNNLKSTTISIGMTIRIK